MVLSNLTILNSFTYVGFPGGSGTIKFLAILSIWVILSYSIYF